MEESIACQMPVMPASSSCRDRLISSLARFMAAMEKAGALPHGQHLSSRAEGVGETLLLPVPDEARRACG